VGIIKRWNWRVTGFDLTKKYEILLYTICTRRVSFARLHLFSSAVYLKPERGRDGETERMIFDGPSLDHPS